MKFRTFYEISDNLAALTESVLFVFQIFVSWGSKGKREKPKNKPFSFAVSTITLKSQFVAKHNKNKPNLENQSVYL